MEEIVNLYGHDTNAFATLTSQLISKVENQDDKKLFTMHLHPKNFGLSDEQGDKLFTDCLTRLRSQNLKGQAKALLSDLRAERGPEKLEQFVNVVKRIQGPETDKSEG